MCLPSFSVERGSYDYFLSFKAGPFTRNLGGFVDERRTVPAFLTYMVLCALCLFAMHSWHFVWSLVNAYYASAYEQQRWYFEFDVVLIVWQSLFMASLHLLLIAAVHGDDANLLHQLVVLREHAKALEFAALALSLCAAQLIPIAVLSFAVEDVGSLRVLDSDGAACAYLLCDLIYLRFVLLYVAYPCALPSLLFALWLCRYRWHDADTDHHLAYIVPSAEAVAASEANFAAAHEQEAATLLGFETTDSASSAAPYRYRLPPASTTQKALTVLLLLWLLSCSFVISFLFGHIHGDVVEQHFGLLISALSEFREMVDFCSCL